MTKGWDHDPPAKEKLVPFGVLMLATGVLTLLFGTAETSDFWGDCLRVWWQSVRAQCHKVRRLVIYLDNGPKNSGSRTQFLKRMIEFADWSSDVNSTQRGVDWQMKTDDPRCKLISVYPKIKL